MGKNAQTINTGLTQIKDAIIQAHNLNNRAAISKEDCIDLGCSEQAFDQWEAYVDGLRVLVNEYIDESLRKDSTDQKVAKAADKVYASWKDVLNQSLGADYDKAWFVRKTDTAWLLRCGAKDVNTVFGSQYGHHEKKAFRRNVERLIGCRLASNEVLSDSDAAIIKEYDGAVSREAALKKRLEGYKKGDEVVMGLKQKVDTLKAEQERRRAEYAKFVAPEFLEKALGGYAKQIVDAEKQLKDCKKNIAAAQQTQKDKKADYDAVMAKINKIEL